MNFDFEDKEISLKVPKGKLIVEQFSLITTIFCDEIIIESGMNKLEISVKCFMGNSILAILSFCKQPGTTEELRHLLIQNDKNHLMISPCLKPQ